MVAVLDDYQQVAKSFADWSVVAESAEIHFFHDHESSLPALVQRLLPFEIICVMRERTPMTEELLGQLPHLRLIVSTGSRNASIDKKTAEELNIIIKPTGYVPSGAPELTWALLMAMARHIPQENKNMKNGKWQTTVGMDLKGRTLGIVGLGNIGKKIAAYATAFEMKVIAWSEHLDEQKAAAAGARFVSKKTLFSESDFISVHLVLSGRSRGIIRKDDLDKMKSTACIINTSRGPIIDEAALIEILQNKKIRGAALDVYDTEPLQENHPFRKMDNVLATPHIGYVTEDTYRVFYQDTVKAIQEWIAAK